MNSSGTIHATLERPAFDAIAALAYRESGLKLVPEKMMMVQSRLRQRLRAMSIDNFDSYTELVHSEDGINERRMMVSALTTNVSHFFREPHHFDLMTSALVPKIRRCIQSGERIRIWSAGCSNGQEPYSVAMHLLQAEPALHNADFKILATDIDLKVVSFAKAGEYGRSQITGISDANKAQFLSEIEGGNRFAVTEAVKRYVTFRELNLIDNWPMQGKFDAIFCRNVVIYFDQETQERLWPRFHNALAPDGCFFLGHSERIAAPAQTGFKSFGPTAYQKLDYVEPVHLAKMEAANGSS